MSKTKVHPPLIRALAHTGIHHWAYDGFDHLIEHGIDAYVDERTDAGSGQRYLVGIDRSKCADRGREILERHMNAFATVNRSTQGPDAFALCRLLLECDDKTLAWWCETKFGPAMEAASREGTGQ